MNVLNVAIRELDNADELGHDDILLRCQLLNLNENVDSYYMLIDNEQMINEETQKKVVLLLKMLLQYWQKELESIKDSNVTFLPIDLSDEYVGTFRVKCIDDDSVKIDYGYTVERQGYSMPMLNKEDTTLYFNEQKYHPETDTILVKKDEIISDIKKSIQNLEKYL